MPAYDNIAAKHFCQKIISRLQQPNSNIFALLLETDDKGNNSLMLATLIDLSTLAELIKSAKLLTKHQRLRILRKHNYNHHSILQRASLLNPKSLPLILPLLQDFSQPDRKSVMNDRSHGIPNTLELLASYAYYLQHETPKNRPLEGKHLIRIAQLMMCLGANYRQTYFSTREEEPMRNFLSKASLGYDRDLWSTGVAELHHEISTSLKLTDLQRS